MSRLGDRLYVSSGTVVRTVDPETLEIAHIGEAWACRLTGALKAAVCEALEGKGGGPLLAALGPEHAVVRALAELAREAPLGLSPPRALALDGFDTLFVELTGACNERCIHCYAEAGPAISAGLDRPLCEAVLDDASELGFQRVQFTGGDPLLCRFLPALLERAHARGIPVCEIFTNGLLLSSALLTSLQPYGPCFALSFYAADPTIHDAITRTQGSQKRTVAAIERILAAGLPVRVAVIAMAENAHTVPQTVSYLRQLGVEQIGVTGARPVGRATAHGPVAFEAGAAETPHAHGPGLTARSGKLCVTYDGLVVPCIFNRTDVLGDLRQRRLREIAAQPRAVRDPAPAVEVITSSRARLQCSSCQLSAFALRAASAEP